MAVRKSGREMRADHETISLNLDRAEQLAQAWEVYANEVEARGEPLVPTEALRAKLGPIYETFVQAKGVENEARRLAYQRVAADARKHAANLRAHKFGVEEQDRENARLFGGIEL